MTEQFLIGRQALVQAGWVNAIENRPGVYVPGESIRRESKPSAWIVRNQTIFETFRPYYQNQTQGQMIESLFG